MDDQPLTRIVAAVLEDSSGRLPVGRGPPDKRHGGLWEPSPGFSGFPEGRVARFVRGRTRMHERGS